jgi:hypothetical protein
MIIVQAPYGEQLEAIELSKEDFLEQRSKMSGMNQVRKALNKVPDSYTARELYRACNCRQVLGLKVGAAVFACFQFI